MRVALRALLVVFLVTAFSIDIAHSVDYTPLTLEASIYMDGTIGINYNLSVDPTLVKVSIPLFGSQFSSLLVYNQNGVPLVNTVVNSSLTIDTIGASGLRVTYATQGLTEKIGTLWTFNITSPSSINVVLPSGATIVSLSQIPVNVQTVNGQTVLTFPDGPLSISYIVSTMGTKEHAQASIEDTAATIATVKASGVNTATADSLLVQSKTMFNAGDYLKADLLASQAKQAALEAASKPATDNNLLFLGGGLFIVIVLAYVLSRRKKTEPKPPVIRKKEVEGPINLEAIFQKNTDLRVDDKEVLRFLSERNGEAFANEIRDRFDIPRTTAWRMIRRLMGMGIVEEKKIGGQSLIFIVKKYRGEPE